MVTIKGIKYMSDFEAKKAIIEVGKRMYNKGFVAANDGNISCRVGPDTLWTTPTGVSKGFMTQDMLVKVDLNGKILMGTRKPSSELKMHIRVYKENTEVMSVTHAHPPIATSFAIAGISLDKAILPEAVVNLGSVPIAHYATPGTEEVPDSIAPYCNTHNAVLLANHGALTWGKDIFEAFYRLESVEYYAQVLMNTGNIIGKANELSCKQVDELIEIREKLGISSGGIPPCAIKATNTKDVITNNVIVAKQEVAATKEEIPKTNHIIPVKTTIDPSCGCDISIKETSESKKTKEQLIQEVVKRVVEQMASDFRR